MNMTVRIAADMRLTQNLPFKCTVVIGLVPPKSTTNLPFCGHSFIDALY